MLDRETKTKLNDAAVLLAQLSEERHEAGDLPAALAAAEAGEYVAQVLDLDALRRRAARRYAVQ